MRVTPRNRRKRENDDHPATPSPAAQAAGRRAVRRRDRLVPAAPGRRGKAPKTVRTYTEAVAWFAAAHLIPRTSCTRWDQVSGHDVLRWLVNWLTLYSDAYASNQFRALQQFFRWLAEEEQLPDPMARLRAPTVTEKLVPVFTSEELSALDKTCQGRSFAQRRDAAIIAVLTATGIRAGNWPGSATTRATRAAVTSTCGGGRSRCGARAAGRGWSGSATGRPGRWTGTSASGPGMGRRGGRSCGWG